MGTSVIPRNKLYFILTSCVFLVMIWSLYTASWETPRTTFRPPAYYESVSVRLTRAKIRADNTKVKTAADRTVKIRTNTKVFAKTRSNTDRIAKAKAPSQELTQSNITTQGEAKIKVKTGETATEKTQTRTDDAATAETTPTDVKATHLPTTGEKAKTPPTTGGKAKTQPATGAKAKTQPTTGGKAKTQPATNSKAWITPDAFHKSLTAGSFEREKLLSLAAEYVSINEDFTWKPSDIHYLNDTEGPCWRDEKSTLGVLCLPKLYLAGFSKCGTTDLWYKLKSHKRLYRTGGGAKEPHWWNIVRLYWPPPWQPSISQKYKIEKPKMTMRMYLDYMTHDPTKGIIDASSGGLTDTALMSRRLDLSKWSRPPSPELKSALKNHQLTSVHLIYQYTPQAKYILILRDPVQRLYSDYLFAYWKWPSLRNRKPSQAEFHKLVQVAVNGFRQCLGRGHNVHYCSYTATFNMISLHKGLYVTYIYDLLKIIKRENLQVVHFDEYIENRAKILEGLFEFLQIGPDPETLEKISQEEKNENGRKEHGNDIGEMWPQTKKLLEQFHKPFNEELATLLDDKQWLFV